MSHNDYREIVVRYHVDNKTLLSDYTLAWYSPTMQPLDASLTHGMSLSRLMIDRDSLHNQGHRSARIEFNGMTIGRFAYVIKAEWQLQQFLYDGSLHALEYLTTVNGGKPVKPEADRLATIDDKLNRLLTHLGIGN